MQRSYTVQSGDSTEHDQTPTRGTRCNRFYARTCEFFMGSIFGGLTGCTQFYGGKQSKQIPLKRNLKFFLARVKLGL